MNKVALLAMMDYVLRDRPEKSVEDDPHSRGPRGFRGPAGVGFDFLEHEQQIKDWAREFSLRFEDLNPEQIMSLTGPKGENGSDGKDFTFEENEVLIACKISEYIDSISEKLKLKFSDLSEDEIDNLKGRSGRDGRDGKSFDIVEHEENIKKLISDCVQGISDQLKLKFSDLTEDEIQSLKGRSGRDGRDGKDFNFDEHKEFFDSLKPKFSDFTEEEVEKLKLKFSDLTEDERQLISLKFSDLSQSQLEDIRGPRGQRGKRGPQGEVGECGTNGKDGLNGERGIQGIPGLPGPIGRSGINGVDGLDGRDAPRIVDVEIEEFLSDIRFVFTYDDGSITKTNWVEFKKVQERASQIFLGGMSSTILYLPFRLRIYQPAETSSTSTVVYSTKATIVATNLVEGDYEIRWMFKYRAQQNNRQYEMQITDNAAQVLTEIKNITNTSDRKYSTGFRTLISLSGNHTFTIDFRVSGVGTTLFISEVELVLERTK